LRARNERVAIVGAGGFAREVEWLISEIGQHDFAGFFVTDRSYMNDATSGDLEDLYELFFESQIDRVVIGVGDPTLRRDLFHRVAKEVPGMRWATLVHPSVLIDRRTSTLGDGCIICAGTIITTNVRVGKNCAVNLSVTVGHDAVIEDHCVVNPGANISGNVTIEEASLIGTGSAIIQKIRIGSGATVGASACVTKDVLSGVTVVGVPAREIKR
jgi:sugar O-acyltransferase (sialic acid O-acetyltransferase NeuD family)